MLNNRSPHQRCWDVVVLLTALALVVAACGDRGDEVADSGDATAFCEQVAGLAAEGDASAEAYRQLAGAAPPEIRGDLEQVAAQMAELEDVEGDDEAAFAAALELMADPDFQAATENVERYLDSECGIETVEPDDIEIVDVDETSDEAASFCAMVEALPDDPEELFERAWPELAAVSPSEIREDMEWLAARFTVLAELRDIDPERAEEARDVLLEDPEYETALRNSLAYMLTECGVVPFAGTG